MHHLAQKTSASWVPAKYRQPGLEIFVPIGYLLVSFFFFSSGYGLTKSRMKKEDYFDGFLIRRLDPILFAYAVTNLIYLEVRFLYSYVYTPLNPYSWYICAITILYTGFYFIYRKGRKHPALLMTLVILSYSIICYVRLNGDWWINSPPVFLVGILFAENEEKIISFISRKKKACELCLLIVFLICFVITEKSGGVYALIKGLIPGIAFSYYWINIPCVLLQVVACSCFSVLVYVLLTDPRKHEQTEAEASGQTVRKRFRDTMIRKTEQFFGFFGAMTLEFYLIHGLFVQFFGHNFFDDKKIHVCYIRNVFLYVLVVFICSAIAAFLLKKLYRLVSDLYGQLPMFRKIFRDVLIIALVVAAGLVVFTGGYTVYRHSLSAGLQPELNEFRDRSITFADVHGKKVSTLVEGDGRYTVVILGSESDPCPTLDYRPLTERLLSKETEDGKKLFRTVTIDFPGKGFSEDSDEERTLSFFTDTIHETLKSLKVDEKFILVADQASALYAFDYMNTYPDDVSAFVGFNPYFPSLARHYLEGNFRNDDEYAWYLKRLVRYEQMDQKFLCATGYVRFQSPVYNYLFYGSGLGDDYDIMEDMYIKRYMQKAQVNEELHLYENTVSLKGYRFPEDLPISILLADDIRDHDYFELDWRKEYNKIITNTDIQTVSIIEGDPGAVFDNPSIFARKIEVLADELLP